jgi:hypothetical protein
LLAGTLVFRALLVLADNLVPELPESERYFQVPTGTPAWLKGHENLLPSVDIATVNEMANILSYCRVAVNELGLRPEYAIAFGKALSRASVLKEESLYAILALYTYEAPDDPRSDILRGALAEFFERDPTVLNYTLPFFRQRVAYLTEQFSAGNIHVPIGSTELGVFNDYLLTWGNEKDKDSLRELLELMITKGKDDYYVRGRAESLFKAFKQETEGPTAGYNKKNILRLQIKTSDYITHGLSQDHAITNPIKPPNGETAGPVGQRSSLVTVKSPKTTRQTNGSESSPNWIAWLAIVIAATAGAAWLFFRKSK